MKKKLVLNVLAPFINSLDLSKREEKRKRRELLDLGKFIIASNDSIEITSCNREKPDFIIKFNGEIFGLEHTEVIDKDKKRNFEFNQFIVQKIEKIFIEKYGNIKSFINISFKNEFVEIDNPTKNKLLKELSKHFKEKNNSDSSLFQTAYPGRLMKQEVNDFSEIIAEKIYTTFTSKNVFFEVNDIVNYVKFSKSSTTSINRNFAYGADTISDLILKSIIEKEEKINTYKQNTNDAKQCLLLVIQGSNGYSDYASFDSNILKNRVTKFDKVIVFNVSKEDIFYLK